MLPESHAVVDGAGNRFAALDLRGMAMPGEGELSGAARDLCQQGTGRPLDGLLVLADARDAAHSFALRYFNRDGSHAAFCGNGARCAAVLAFPGRQVELTFESDSGVIRAVTTAPGASIAMPEPSAVTEMPVGGDAATAHFLEVGVPHLVVWSEAPVEMVDVEGVGAALRRHAGLGPAGANVNFVNEVNPSTIRIRTFERGVEGETGACGSGAAAAAIAHAVLRQRNGVVRTIVLPASGAELIVSFFRDRRGVRDLWLEGPARLIEWRSCSPAPA